MARQYASALSRSGAQLLELVRYGVATFTANELGVARSYVPSLLTLEIRVLESLVRNGALVSISDLPAYLDAAKSLGGTGIDDRLHLLEKLLVLMSRLPVGSIVAKRLEHLVTDILYKDLPHPPGSYLSSPGRNCCTKIQSVPYAFRAPDGSNHSPYFPSLGQAGTPYARSMPAFKAIPASSLPDPGLVFDLLLRRDKFHPHPGGLSSLFFAFANIVIHSIFNTNRVDPTINDSSSYLDLSPLYGSSQEQVDQVRRKDGTGRLWDDVFADHRLLLMPPSVCALLILFNRNHNYIAEKILSINEKGSYGSPPALKESDRGLQDDEIFERARLVNCGFFMQIILRDYIGAVLHLVQDGQQWRLNPLELARDIDHEFRPPGQGNAVSIEFNHFYRWHATLSESDTKWLETLFRAKFGEDVDFRTISAEKFKEVARGMIPQKDVKEWTFNGLQRQDNGRFPDVELASVLLDATGTPAGAFGARHIPEVMRVVEILAMERSRAWGTCSLNEFRTFIGLKPYHSFREWNSNPEVYTAAQALYKEIDKLELHVGLQAEETKRPSPGTGLCPGYTVSRAILADAIALTRGDRFVTLDFTPFNLTSWGFNDCVCNLDDGSYGGMLTKLLFRTLPSCYPVGSVYSHFPFLAPDHLKLLPAHSPTHFPDKYSWSRPHPVQVHTVISKYHLVSAVMERRHLLSASHQHRLRYLGGLNANQDPVNIVWNGDDIVKSSGAYLSRMAELLIRQKSVDWTGSGCSRVNIVGDVINMLPIIWFKQEFTLLDTSDSFHLQIQDRELYQMFQDVGNYIFLNTDPASEWELRESALQAASKLIELIRAVLVQEHARSLLLSNKWSRFLIGYIPDDSARGLKAQILAKNKDLSLTDLARSLFSELVPTMAIFSQTLVNIVDFYMHENRRTAREAFVGLLRENDAQARDQVLAYINEAIRLDPPVNGVHWTAVADLAVASLDINNGTSVFLNIRDAGLDTDFFGPNPAEPVYDRPIQCSLIWNLGLNGFLSSKFFQEVAPEILRVVLGLRNLQPVPGPTGRIHWIQDTVGNVTRKLYIDRKGCARSFANSFMLQYDKPEE